MTTAEMLKQANQALKNGKLSWADYRALVLALKSQSKKTTAKK